MREVSPAFLLLEVLLRENQAFVPERFVDPHRCGFCRVMVGHGWRILYASNDIRIPLSVLRYAKHGVYDNHIIYEISATNISKKVIAQPHH
jgi:hypothetical protein